MQYFKGDDDEKKFANVGVPVLESMSLHKTEMFNGVYTTGPLGDLIYNTMRAPLSNAISQNIFRLAFGEIFDAFVNAGSFESYLTVFRKIFGSDVSVTFSVPGPGQLTIALIASSIEVANLVSRYVEDNVYLYDEIIDYDGANFIVQTIKGFQSQYELETMLFEMVPGGVFTTISLTFGGS